MYTVLICDDEADIRRALRIYLENDGYRVLEAADGREALELARSHTLHLVLLDVMMPGPDGLEVTQRLRELGNVPVLLLTAKSEDLDKVRGLTVGADDYVTKPFEPLELLARVKALIRRYTYLGGQSSPSVLEVGLLTIDDEAKQVCLAGEPVSLTPTEYAILRTLAGRPGKVWSVAELCRALEPTGLGAESSVAVHIRHLREKLEADPADPRYLQVVWGQGYKLTEGGQTR